jgi:aminoglycoside phosphotransferase (APT) family kinase protein
VSRLGPVAGGLAAWLAERWGEPVDVGSITQSSAGARRGNVLFTATSAARGEQRLAATILPTAEIQLLDIETEATVRTVALEGGVPVPAIVGVCTDPATLGGPFFVSEAIDGETIPRRVLRLVAEHGIGQTVATQLGEALARLHAVDPARAPAGLPRPGTGPLAAALDGVIDAHDALLRPEPAFAYGIRWLREHLPAEPGQVAIVHTDARNGNIIVGPDGLRAVLDWEGAHLGDPMEDTAWPCTRMWRFGHDADTVGGFGSLGALRDGYEAAGGEWDDERFRWWRVLGTLRWGLGLAGQARAHLEGRFRSIVMAGSGRRVSELAYDVLLLVR